MPRRKSPIADNILYNFLLSSSSSFSSFSMDASYCLIAIWHAENRRKNQSCQYNLFLCTYFFVADPLQTPPIIGKITLQKLHISIGYLIRYYVRWKYRELAD